jgi:hypothetical protein
LPGRPDALRAWFLGPRAENAELLERLVLESLRDHVFWRRNYHPEDGFTIREADKRRPGYEDAVATLTQELLGLLAELKRDVPVFSGRYKGHMIAEQTIAAQVGWFATMLYNPNNIAVDISPVTTRLVLRSVPAGPHQLEKLTHDRRHGTECRHERPLSAGQRPDAQHAGERIEKDRKRLKPDRKRDRGECRAVRQCQTG